MTSKRQRKLNRENSAAGMLRRIRQEALMSSPFDAATWHPDAYGDSPWNPIVWPGAVPWYASWPPVMDPPSE